MGEKVSRETLGEVGETGEVGGNVFRETLGEKVFRAARLHRSPPPTMVPIVAIHDGFGEACTPTQPAEGVRSEERFETVVHGVQGAVRHEGEYVTNQ